MDQILFYIQYAPVASAIFAATILISLLAFYNDELYSKSILQPYSIARGSRVYTLITSGFIHKDWMHLFFNMYSFQLFALNLEVRIGHWQFALLYIVSLIVSDIPTVLKHKDDYWYNSLGASGAISAVVFSFILFKPMMSLGLIFIPFLELPAIVFGALYLIYCVYASRKGIGNINHDAHFYGALCGIIITIVLYPVVLTGFIDSIRAGMH
ncbi:rhomboid family protein [Mucilaginibacter gracilis]|uniref:Rhomboid family protein n=1 Tax=Mucilaginibacter gracilis TaxID=423350 RepID=A0A495IXH4_9SPHI|nr:rhomboid family intramembrane serine protease [Mucilaginibacter gracilis]RKR81272.1 rhomboid family protein [Mucilaginibacter gracilis]